MVDSQKKKKINNCSKRIRTINISIINTKKTVKLQDWQNRCVDLKHYN